MRDSEAKTKQLADLLYLQELKKSHHSFARYLGILNKFDQIKGLICSLGYVQKAPDKLGFH